MSIYKSVSPDSAVQSILTSSAVGSIASSHVAAQTNVGSSHGSGATFSENDNTDTGGANHPGTIAGITIGSVSGVFCLMALIILVARWGIRRSQRRSAGARTKSVLSVETTPAALANNEDATSIRDAKKVDLRRLDGVVMDHHSPSPRLAAKNQVGVAATTGADWTSNKSSPLTPRTPRFAYPSEETQLPMPSIVVHPPEIAPIRGLGERAWHRRRLSAPFPPAGVVDDGRGSHVENERRDNRRALPSQSSGKIPPVGPADMPMWRDGQEAVSALSEDEWVSSSSWTWTLSSQSGTPEAEAHHYKAYEKK